MGVNKIKKFAFALFGRHVRNNKEHYSATRMALRQARIAIPWDIYVSTAYLYAIITSILGIAFGYLLMPLWRFLYPYYLRVVPRIGFTAISDSGEAIFSLVITVIISLFIGFITLYVVLEYPSLLAQVRKRKIDLTLPHATAYMHALSKGGLPLISIFKSLGEHTNIYGESAEEIAYIVRETEWYGNDIITAIKNASFWTPSAKFRDFLDNLTQVAETGGNLDSFFSNMVNHYQTTAAAEQRLYLEMLGMFAEIYITAFVAGPLFLITILIVMGIMGPGSLLMLKFIIYVAIPLSGTAFCVFLSAVSIQSDSRLVKIYTVSKKMKHYEGVRTVFSEGDEKRIRKFIHSLRWMSIIEVRRNPFKIFFSNPVKAFYITIPAGIFYFILSIYKHTITIDLLDDVIIISILILFVPFLFFYEMQSKRIREIDNSVPDFLRRMAIVNEVGMPLTDAIKSISKINLGVLSTEVKLMYKDLVWTHSIVDAFTKFERRVRTVSISRIITLITKASETTSNIKETLRVAANDAELSEKLRHEKFTALMSYLIVVYVAFGVFLLVLYVFTTMFLPHIPDTSNTSAASGMFNISANKKEYSMLFMHASVIQGFFSGIIAGQMMGESVYDGLKHSVIMMTTAYIFFVLLI